jgi:hypothetical protein
MSLMDPHHRVLWFGDGVFIKSLYEPIDFSASFQDGQNDALLCHFVSSKFSITHFRLIGTSFASKEGSGSSLREEGSSRRK